MIPFELTPRILYQKFYLEISFRIQHSSDEFIQKLSDFVLFHPKDFQIFPYSNLWRNQLQPFQSSQTERPSHYLFSLAINSVASARLFIDSILYFLLSEQVLPFSVISLKSLCSWSPSSCSCPSTHHAKESKIATQRSSDASAMTGCSHFGENLNFGCLSFVLWMGWTNMPCSQVANHLLSVFTEFWEWRGSCERKENWQIFDACLPLFSNIFIIEQVFFKELLQQILPLLHTDHLNLNFPSVIIPSSMEHFLICTIYIVLYLLNSLS